MQVNYHTVADFRSQHNVLDDLLTDNLACLMAAGGVKLKSVAQDDVRVRASAGAASFRREEKLKSYLETARERVAVLKQEINDDPAASTWRKDAAKMRAAEEREARIEAALARLPEVADIKKRQGKKPEEARVSTTDAEASVMKTGAVCAGAQPDEQVAAGTGIDRHRDRYVRRSRNGGLKAEDAGKSSNERVSWRV